jgi:hypothetical protein
MRFLTVFVSAAVLMFALPAISASPPAPTPMTPQQNQAVVDAIRKKINELYVFPEKRAQIDAALSTDMSKGRFTTPSHRELAERLSETLFTASNDKHLTVSFDPQRANALAAPGRDPGAEFFDAEGRKWNQGYVRQEILPGNVRYIRIKTFFWTGKVTASVIDSAARFLSGGSAAIIDLRGNGGGHSEAVQRMISYLMPAKSTELMTFFDGQTGKSEVTRSTAALPSARVHGRPIYVLVDRGSASATEEFAYHIQQFKLGTLVGETTAGAANNNMLLALPEGFVGSVSFGRPIHPISKTNWEGVGVAPDKQIASPAALDAALLAALSTLSSSDDQQAKVDAIWELPAVRARLTPVKVGLSVLKSLAGKYGDREVRLTGQTLAVHRNGRPPVVLTPLSSELFAVLGNDDARFLFVRQPDEKILLEVIFRDGRKQASQREAK